MKIFVTVSIVDPAQSTIFPLPGFWLSQNKAQSPAHFRFHPATSISIHIITKHYDPAQCIPMI